MIKEVFEIEPIQKNSLITLGCLTCISYLQLDLFSHHLKLDNIFTSLMISFALSICWIVSNSISCYYYFQFIIYDRKSESKSPVIDRVILIVGTLTVSWVILFTYIGYEFQLTFKNFIRVSLTIIFLRTLFWIILLNFKENKGKSLNKQELVP